MNGHIHDNFNLRAWDEENEWKSSSHMGSMSSWTHRTMWKSQELWVFNVLLPHAAAYSTTREAEKKNKQTNMQIDLIHSPTKRQKVCRKQSRLTLKETNVETEKGKGKSYKSTHFVKSAVCFANERARECVRVDFHLLRLGRMWKQKKRRSSSSILGAINSGCLMMFFFFLCVCVCVLAAADAAAATTSTVACYIPSARWSGVTYIHIRTIHTDTDTYRIHITYKIVVYVPPP